MKSPYEVHAYLAAQAQAFLGGQPGNGNRMLGATLALFGIIVPCTHSEVRRNWILDDGKSIKTFVEYCEFIASDLPAAVPATNPPQPMAQALEKGVFCQLKLNPNLPPLPMRLWIGGLQPGGLLYRFMLVGADYGG